MKGFFFLSPFTSRGEKNISGIKVGFVSCLFGFLFSLSHSPACKTFWDSESVFCELGIAMTVWAKEMLFVRPATR